ncbi:hypothetical protein GGH17_005224, partial [Coemansia sp. RSA 788]
MPAFAGGLSAGAGKSLGRSASQQHLPCDDVQTAPFPRPTNAYYAASPSSSQTSLNYPSKLRDAMATLRFLRLNGEKTKPGGLGESMPSLVEAIDESPPRATQAVQYPHRLQSRTSLPHVSPSAAPITDANRRAGAYGPGQELSAMHILSAATSLPSIRTSLRDGQKTQLDSAKSQMGAHMFVPISPLEQRREQVEAGRTGLGGRQSSNWALREEDEDENLRSDVGSYGQGSSVNASSGSLGLQPERGRRAPRRSMSYSAQTHSHSQAVELSARESQVSLRVQSNASQHSQRSMSPASSYGYKMSMDTTSSNPSFHEGRLPSEPSLPNHVVLVSSHGGSTPTLTVVDESASIGPVSVSHRVSTVPLYCHASGSSLPELEPAAGPVLTSLQSAQPLTSARSGITALDHDSDRQDHGLGDPVYLYTPTAMSSGVYDRRTHWKA